MILSANIGNFDKPIVPWTVGAQIRCYTEANLPHPLPNLNNRLKGKYIKIMAHRFLDAQRYIWIDGSVQPLNDLFQREMYGMLRESGADVVIAKHPERKGVYEELDYIAAGMKDGKQYLIDRYANEPLNAEFQFYEKQGLPYDFPLYVCRMFARQCTPKVNEAFNDWWLGCLEYSNFDQTYFSYVVWKHKLKIATFDYHSFVGSLVKVNRHNDDPRNIT